MSARWVEIPAHRVYVVGHLEYWDETQWRRIDEDGREVDAGGIPYRVVRVRDGKLFRPATYDDGALTIAPIGIEYVAILIEA